MALRREGRQRDVRAAHQPQRVEQRVVGQVEHRRRVQADVAGPHDARVDARSTPLKTSASCESITPFGKPVVPPVWKTPARSLPPRPASVTAAWRSISASYEQHSLGRRAVAQVNERGQAAAPGAQIGDHRREVVVDQQHARVAVVERAGDLGRAPARVAPG
jgi:hypothetical protein